MTHWIISVPLAAIAVVIIIIILKVKHRLIWNQLWEFQNRLEKQSGVLVDLSKK